MSQAVYRPRQPQNSSYYQCVQDHFETFDQVYEDRFERRYGFFRPYVRQVIYRYLDCGDLLGYNPHLHVLISDGCFHESGLLTVAPAIDTQALEQLFRHKILKLLLSEGRITEATVALMGRWRHSGFSVHCGPRILPRQTAAMENLGRYIIRLHHPGLVFPGAP
jgi:hypothetical protein